MWFVYLLECSDDKRSLYCGITNNLEKRIKTHNSGNNKSAKFTRYRLPVRLVYFENFPNRSVASKEEYRIKNLSREEKLKLIALKNPIYWMGFLFS